MQASFDFNLPEIKLTFDEIRRMCTRFERVHDYWPEITSTRDEFAKISHPDVDGKSLNDQLISGQGGLINDPEFKDFLHRRTLDGQPFINLHSLSSDEYRKMPRPDVEDLVRNVKFSLDKDFPQSKEGTIYFGMPSSIMDAAMEAAGLDRMFFVARSLRVSASAKVTKPLLEFIDRAGMVYGSEPSEVSTHYSLKLSDQNRLEIRYSTILGSRMIAAVPPELVSQLTETLKEQCLDFARRAPEIPVRASSAEGADLPKKRQKTVTIESELAYLTAEGQSILLPDDRHLSRYKDIAALLHDAGGSYVMSKQRFDFDEGIDCVSVLERLQAGDKVNFKNQYQFFATPKEEGYELCASAGPLQGKRVLEPSAGDGGLADIAREMGAEVVTVEAWNVNVNKLVAKGYDPITADFLTLSPDDLGYFDAIVANPPFSNNQDIDHVMHMTQFLKPGGSLSVIMSPAWVDGKQKKHRAFIEFLEEHNVSMKKIDAGAFSESGTSIATVRLDFKDFQLTNDATKSLKTTRPRPS